jgi:hypothetical protein
VRSSSSRSTPATASSAPSATSQPIEAPVLARRFSCWRGGFATGLVVAGGLVVVTGDVVVVVETGGVVVETGGGVVVETGGVVVETGGVVLVVVDDVVEDVVVLVLVMVDVVVEMVVDGFVYVVVDVVVVDVVAGGVVCVVGSPRVSGERHPGWSFGHHAAAHTRPSPEASASGDTPYNPTTVNTAPAVSTPM